MFKVQVKDAGEGDGEVDNPGGVGVGVGIGVGVDVGWLVAPAIIFLILVNTLGITVEYVS